MDKFSFLCFYCLFCLLSIGCGQQGLKVQMVQGDVTLDGKPFDGVTITFVPSDGGNMGFATTDEQGHYSISTLGARPATGTTVGSYKVCFDKLLPDGPRPTEKELADPNFNPYTSTKYNLDKVKQHVPKKYLNVNTSGFEVTVAEGRNTFDFALKSK